ncbi:MAG: alpha/beta fold hydrolase [Alphaproteobacteria bacterium]|nr:alpha/beta fold hydrolase [Alphaproteobacteria bacterium]MDI9329863.1 alpha/beta fold hydrolase [Alphaproteobacteria bacterium]
MIEILRHHLPHGIELSCRVSGEPGQPVLMFLHGFPEAAFVWDDMLAHYARPENGGYRCVAPNLRGFADSSAPTDVAAYRAKHLLQDVLALIDLESPTQPLAALVAHDWGGAVAWALANQHPARMRRLAIFNSPHPGTFWRELRNNPAQQAASAYMNFLIRPDAAALLSEQDFRRLWGFFAEEQPPGTQSDWLDEAMRQRYREVWSQGLEGGLNYYRASPLRPAREGDAGAAGVELPDAMWRIEVPTLVLWGMRDRALLPCLLEGLEAHIPQLEIRPLAQASHWLVHEQPDLVKGHLSAWLQS